MKCFNCGKEINDNSKFCCYCGSNLENKKTVNNNKKRKVAIKKEYKILFTLLSIFLLIFVFQFFLVRFHYNRGIFYLNKWLDASMDGNNPEYVGNSGIIEIPELEDIEKHFNKCKYYAIFGMEMYFIDDRMVNNCVNDLIIYKQTFDTRPTYYTLYEWQETKNKISYTNNERFNDLLKKIELECCAAEEFYNLDFDNAYSKIEPFKDIFPHFLEEMNYISNSLKVIDRSNIKNKLNTSKISEIIIFREYKEIKYEKYPMILIKLEDDIKNYFLIPDNNSNIYNYYENYSTDYIFEMTTYHYDSNQYGWCIELKDSFISYFFDKLTNGTMKYFSYVTD